MRQAQAPRRQVPSSDSVIVNIRPTLARNRQNDNVIVSANSNKARPKVSFDSSVVVFAPRPQRKPAPPPTTAPAAPPRYDAPHQIKAPLKQPAPEWQPWCAGTEAHALTIIVQATSCLGLPKFNLVNACRVILGSVAKAGLPVGGRNCFLIVTGVQRLSDDSFNLVVVAMFDRPFKSPRDWNPGTLGKASWDASHEICGKRVLSLLPCQSVGLADAELLRGILESAAKTSPAQDSSDESVGWFLLSKSHDWKSWPKALGESRDPKVFPYLLECFQLERNSSNGPLQLHPKDMTDELIRDLGRCVRRAASPQPASMDIEDEQQQQQRPADVDETTLVHPPVSKVRRVTRVPSRARHEQSLTLL